MTSLLRVRLVRRLVVVPLVVALTIVMVLLLPLLGPLALVSDVVRGRREGQHVRLLFMVTAGLIVESLGLFAALIAWVRSGFGFLWRPETRWHLHRATMGWYARAMLWVITRALGTHVVWHDKADLSSGPVVLLARHTSFFDALIPATLLSQRNKLLAHHVLTEGLRYAPCIDVVGHRFPLEFVNRQSGDSEAKLASIEALGRVVNERSAAVIFPEGTFRTPKRFAFALERVAEHRPTHLEQVKRFRHVLPPRTNGTLALLAGAPQADVVLCMNTGLEPFGTLRQIVTNPRATRPVIVATERIARADIPTDPGELEQWIIDQFDRIDNWVSTHQ